LRRAAPDEVGSPLTWAQVDAALHDAVSMIEVKEINGTAADVLDYVNFPKGSSVIAVGGDKLSRGLTLEGLSISYFLRTSRMYDTLMQMGRWFGYRPEYLDLCRLFTTDYLRRWYRHIALAEEELRREFDYMAAQGATPENYGLGVRSHSEGLIVTALNKMCHARTLELSFAGDLKQTAHFATDIKVRRENLSVLESFLGTLPAPEEHKSEGRVLGWVWSVEAQHLCDGFFQEFSIHSQCHTIDRKRVTDFIRRQNQQGELTHWTVALVNNSKAAATKCRQIAGLPVGLTERERDGAATSDVYSTTKANIQSPRHQAFDLERMKPDAMLVDKLLTKQNQAGRQLFDAEEERRLREAVCNGQTLAEVALSITRKRAEPGKNPDTPNGRVIRELRPVTHGLLLIYALAPTEGLPDDEPPYLGIALSFPTSHTVQPISYEANKRLIEEFQDERFEDQ
jgi:hypothetical protein